jgi:uncharacterized protein (TIGR00369 family)
VGYDILNGEHGLYFRLPIRRDHLNPHGVLHGGVPLTLLDAVGGRTLIDRPIPGSDQLIQSSVTVTLTVDFMRAVGAGILFASSTPDHIGKTLAYVSVKVTLDDLYGDIVSRGIGTYRIYTKSLVKAV